MAKPTRSRSASAPNPVQLEQVSGNRLPGVPSAVVGSAAVYKQHKGTPRKADDRHQIAQPWQREAYRQVNICGEARKAVTLHAALASRAEIGISEPQTKRNRPQWVNSGIEVDVLAEVAPTVRDRTKLVRDYIIHRNIAGECYLIARDRHPQDPDYESRRRDPVWEIVAVTELRRMGETWQVRLDNNDYVDLAPTDPIIRMWNPDPENRREAWSPMRSLLPTLREIEWLTGHIFTQVRSRLMSAGIWFLPENLTFAPPPPDSVEGGAEAIAAMNEPEQFMMSLAASGNYELDLDEVSFPTVVMADAAALASIDKDKLIQFWSEIDDKAMTLRSDAIRRFALGWDLPPEQLLGSSGVAISGSGGSAGSVNHWGEWAQEEKTIAAHIEPALDDFVAVLTVAVLRAAVENTTRVVAYDPTSIRMKQDLSKLAIELRNMGLLSAATTVREAGFDPEYDMMDDREWVKWALSQMLAGSPTPEMMVEAMRLLTGLALPVPEQVSGNETEPKGLPGPAQPPNLDDHLVKGPPEGDHEHKDAPYAALLASCEVLVLRALEKAGNRLLNEGRRGRDRDRNTPPHLAHMVASIAEMPSFDFSLLPTVLDTLPAGQQARIGGALNRYCARLYAEGEAYSREGLVEAMEGL